MEKHVLYRQVAQLHVDNINQGFLATLGVGFVSLMYQAIDEAQDSLLLVEEREGRVVGFVSGGNGMRAIYKRMLRHPLRLGFALLPSALSPKRVLRILEILRYSQGKNVDADLPDAELLSIAVDPGFRGQQLAEGLYRRLEAHFRRGHITAFKITVGEALVPAHRFYQRMSALPIAKVEVHEGEASTIYVQNLI